MRQDQNHEIQKDDSCLVHDVRSGKLESYEELVRRHECRIFRLVGSHLPWSQVEEVAHDVFVRAWSSLAHLEKPDRFSSWLSSIAVRCCCDYWRQHHRQGSFLQLENEDGEHENSEDTWPLLEMACRLHREQCRQEELQHTVEDLLMRLPIDESRLIRMIYLEGASLTEVSDIAEISSNHLRVKIHRIKNKLKGFIQESIP